MTETKEKMKITHIVNLNLQKLAEENPDAKFFKITDLNGKFKQATGLSFAAATQQLVKANGEHIVTGWTRKGDPEKNTQSETSLIVSADNIEDVASYLKASLKEFGTAAATLPPIAMDHDKLADTQRSVRRQMIENGDLPEPSQQ